MGVRVKICGFTTARDVEIACDVGVDAIGFVREPSSARYVDEIDAIALAGRAAPFVTTVAVYGESALTEPSFADYVQAITFGRVPAVGRRIVARRVATGLTPESVVAGLEGAILLLDAFADGTFGGSGKTIDWGLARAIVEISPLPVVLAGGLTPDNVAQAIDRVRPAGVDVSSGVEISPGVKDPIRLRDFVAAARGA